jgi:WhiB family transcriptional regulator, redox-sensing transcriptional regulator
MSTAEVLDLSERRPDDTSTDDVVDLPDHPDGRAVGHVRDLREPWWEHARCRGSSGRVGDLFFSGKPRDIARAKRICAGCVVMEHCLEGALTRREPWGVWGGQLFLDGRILATKRPRGRPRKVPRPEDRIPEIPIPARLRRLAVVHIT